MLFRSLRSCSTDALCGGARGRQVDVGDTDDCTFIGQALGDRTANTGAAPVTRATFFSEGVMALPHVLALFVSLGEGASNIAEIFFTGDIYLQLLLIG